MTLSQIILNAIRQLGEDPQDMDDFKELFKAYANEGYRIAVEEYVHPLETRMYTTDCHGHIPIYMYHRIRRVVSIRDKNGLELPFQLSLDGREAATAVQEECVSVLYETTFPDMDKQEDEPEIPEDLHPALADYICYRHLSTGNLAKQQRGQMWRDSFYRRMGRVRREGYGSTTHFKNLYAASDIRRTF